MDSMTKRWIRNAADERAASEGYRFDEERGQFVVDWMRDYLYLYEGDCAGQPFECHDWQYEATMRLFGWVRMSDRLGRDVRRFRKASIWIPKKNKKSPTIAAWACYMLAGDGELGQKVYLAAKDGAQVRQNVAMHVLKMIEQSPQLLAECKINLNEMSVYHRPTNSKLLPLSSSNARTQKSKEGLNGSVFIDEVHVMDREFVNRIDRAGISRAEPLHVEVSTAGDDPDSYGKERYDYAVRVSACDGVYDPQTLAIIYEAKQDLTDAELADDPVRWGQTANPAWGHTIHEEEYLSDYNASRQSAGAMALFKMYRLNIWQQTLHPWIRRSDWDACRDVYTENDLLGQPCGAGLDLSKCEDTSSLSLCFPTGTFDQEAEPVCRLLTWFWIPEATIQKHRHQIAYRDWAEAGWLTVIPGDVIDYAVVERDAAEILGRFDCRRLHFDAMYATASIQRLNESLYWGDDVAVKFPQTIIGFTGPTARFERMVVAHKMRHNGNPMLAWQIGNTQIKYDANANMRPVKPEREDLKKIDGSVASIMALEAAVLMPSYRSPYEDGGTMYAEDV